MAVKAISKTCRKNRNSRGITLVELIVVLVIMSILAASGIFSAVGFVKRSQLTQNDKNAETIYQAAQTALLQLEKSGSIDTWVKNKLIASGCGTAFDYDSGNPSSNEDFEKSFDPSGFSSDTDTTPNKTWHMRYVMTTYPGKDDAQSKNLKELIQPYFYDATIFNGTVTVEFDVEKAYDARKNPHYSARALSVFASSRDKSGWSGATVPKRAISSRGKTLIGYYDGYTGFSVDTVYLPKIEDGLSIREFSYDNMTGRLSWIANLERHPVTGHAEHIYYMIELYPGKENSKRFFINEDFLFSNVTVATANKYNLINALSGKAEGDMIMIGGKSFEVHVAENDLVYVHTNEDDSVDATVTETYIEVEARVYSNRTATHDNYKAINSSTPMISVPLRVTLVHGEHDEDDNIKPDYIIYSLDISSFLDDTESEASLIVCPNDFTDASDLKSFNDRTGIVPMNKGKNTDIGPVVVPEEPEEGGEGGEGGSGEGNNGEGG
jgi:prepilin-type N-terminal cleavage/methylation domain-containing protein